MPRRLLIAFALFLSCGAASADVVPASAIRVVDGDTVAIAGRRYRLLRIDAPETHQPHCAAEKAAGERATAVLDEFVHEPDARIDVSIQHLDPTGHADRYGRDFISLSVNGQDAAGYMLSSLLALPYEPGRPAKLARIQHWCPEYTE